MAKKQKVIKKTFWDGQRVIIPTAQVEFVVGGDTIWIQSPRGATVMRVKTIRGGITVSICQSNPVSHADMIVNAPIEFCLADDAKRG